MRGRLVTGLMLLMTVSTFLVAPVFAKSGVVYRANGKLVKYTDPEYTDAEIVDGSWNVEIRDGNVINFNAEYKELNNGGPHEIPNDEAVGKIDHFKLYLVDPEAELDGDTCTITATLLVDAKHWDPVTLKPFWTYKQPWGEVTIKIDSLEIQIDLPYDSTYDLDIDIEGTTISIHY